MKQADVEKCFEWLDKVRKGGTVNMLSARPAMAKIFHLDTETSKWVHAAWMKTFNPMEPVTKRAAWAVNHKEDADAEAAHQD